jgi:glutamate dehydrogenase (NAD(P)+)
MNWVRQRYAQRRRSREDARFAGVVTGKPVGYGFDGIPGRNEATGYGLVSVMNHIMQKHLARKTTRWFGRKNVVIMGFGNVGSHAALFAQESGHRVIAVSDVNGGIYNPKGLDIGALIDYANVKKTIFGAPYGDKITNEELLRRIRCDILIPAALENVITTENVNDIRAKLIVEGANGPTTPEADKILQANGIVVVPDILANAGGVTVSFFEWARNVNIRDERVPVAQKDAVLKAMSGMLTDAADSVFETADKYQASLRHAAYIAAIDRAAPLFKAKHIA